MLGGVYNVVILLIFFFLILKRIERGIKGNLEEVNKVINNIKGVVKK
jgi:hypothetical protein